MAIRKKRAFADAKPRQGRTSHNKPRIAEDPTAGNAPRMKPHGVDSTNKHGRGSQKMDDGTFQENFTAMMQDAVQYTDDELSPIRATATDLYMGRPFGNEKEGRSQAILTEVRDGVQAVLPDLLEVLFAPQKVVEFKPNRAEQVEQAAQATDYVQQIFMEHNPGFIVMHSVLKDGLVRKMGVVKWGWDESKCAEDYTLEHLTQEELDALTEDESITLNKVVRENDDYSSGPEPAGDESDEPQGITMPPGQMAMTPPSAMSPMADPSIVGAIPPQVPLFTVDLTWKTNTGRVRVWAVPPEEFIFSREARSIEDAILVAHRTEKTRSEMIALGIDEAFIDEHAGLEDLTIQSKPEELARRIVLSGTMAQDPPSGAENKKSAYTEAYFRADRNGDRLAELRRVIGIGPRWAVWKDTAVASAPFALFCPDPEPHTILGLSWADRLADMQLIKSSLLRATLDSAAASIFPRTWFIEGMANLTDILNTEIGAPIRTRGPGAVGEFAHTFMGREMFPLFGMLDGAIERRTGRSNAVMGMDADALQSTEKDAAQAAIQGSQVQATMLARIAVEQVVKPLFRGILRMLVEHQPRAELVKMRGRWVTVDPKSWDATMGLTVTTALGRNVQRKIQVLQGVLAKQEAYYTQLGPQNPMVSVGMIRHTIGKILELEDIPDTENYFRPLPVGFDPPPPPAPPASPEHELAMAQVQVEQMRVTKEIAVKHATLAQKALESGREFQLKVASQAQDTVTKRMQIDAQFKTDFAQMQVDKETQQGTALLNALIDAEAQHHQMEMDHTANAAADAGDPTPDNPIPQEDPNAPPTAPPADGGTP
jgi:hypothetical protein